ncbi:MAG TPA: undecaprenyldiphospho-muramoylpentapeptide beta-N-acetylglucosaminyltransferase [Thermoanaerobaculia bacterium]|jgi:UDP-N-acetylglucosamine--N-acetylmuramyl-(pentapeptide) pyrophosphoryl-undecaprenol N-acetylglucosamine transferase|nr:undecaprenyldiphospho-muramoylpentapeptide beta-N-acetylglucosaminyltransferase [Thermoanaerobaculia bacterium]
MTTSGSGAYVIAAGGTGGHIMPGIALADEIRARRAGVPIVFVGTAQGLETQIVAAAGYPLELVDASGFVGKTLGKQIRSLSRLPKGFFEARALLRRHRARAVVGVGGYVTVPVLMAARSLGIPTLIHESNARPGVANRFLNRFATRTAVGLAAANAHLRRAGVVTGTPVRREFFDVPPLDPEAASRRLFVFGGSQGSRVINRAMARAAVLLEKSTLEVMHQTGEKDLTGTRQRYPRMPANWKLEPFLPRLWEQIAAADLVVSRAGAMTVAELAAAGRPAILVPFGASAAGHQLENARALAKAGAVVVIAEKDLTAESLAGTVVELFRDRARLTAMGQKAKALARPDAARDLARLLFEAEVSR